MSEADLKLTLCFVDTNVWLYAFIAGSDETKSKQARQLLQHNEGSLLVSSQVINEVCANLLKKAHLPEAEIRELVRSFYSRYPVILLGQEVQVGASDLRGRLSLSFWDSLILAAAIHGGASIVYSEDLQADLQVDKDLVVRNPFAS
ncbi:MAG TPA: PIN domain-containing protein [Chloroflexi bacterium]|nr:PIN domain-containing protein [Chloroflexota bacterium]